MKKNTTLRAIAFGLAVIAVSIVLSSASEAKAASGSSKVIYLTKHEALKVLRLLARDRTLRSKLLKSDCGCVQDFGPGLDCFGSCLRTAGVSPIQVVMCGVACAAWETGVGLVVCAICVGLDVTSVEFCALYCLTHRDGGKEIGPLLDGRNMRPRSGVASVRRAATRFAARKI